MSAHLFLSTPPAEVDDVVDRAQHVFDYYDHPAMRVAAWRELARIASSRADEALAELAQLVAEPLPLFAIDREAVG